MKFYVPSLHDIKVRNTNPFKFFTRLISTESETIEVQASSNR